MSKGLPRFFSDHPACENVLSARIHALRKEIGLAQTKRTGIDAAIANRQQTLVRLEAQLALLQSPAQSAPRMSADS